MGCCGQKRSQLRAPQGARDAGPLAAASDAAKAEPTASTAGLAEPRRGLAAGVVAIRYRGRAHVMVEGPATGAPYEFSGQRPVRLVDGRDAVALLQTPYFEAGGAPA